MKEINPLFLADVYKVGHVMQYAKGTSKVYSNFTPRWIRPEYKEEGINSVVFFGLNYFIKEYLIDRFNKDFFNRPKKEVVSEYAGVVKDILGVDISTKHLEELHDIGYLPIHIKALPEFSEVPVGVPMFTIVNTRPEAYWLTNYIETLMSCIIWKGCTGATIAKRYYKIIKAYAMATNPEMVDFVRWQGHDFSFRGMSCLESACINGAAHLRYFHGTDTIPAKMFIKKYYGTDVIAGSVPATEHSVMEAGGTGEDEFNTYKRLITEVYPKGIVSIVSDTWDFWNVVTDYLPKLKETILQRDGKVVIRPDSGDPELILCGDPNAKTEHERKGLIRCLWDIFGGTVTSKGFLQLNPHIGAIYGDSITLKRARSICDNLKAKGFASTNVVFGIGSYTYNYNTRDSFGFAIKSTWCEINGVGKEIFKTPKTDTAGKKSAKGLLLVVKDKNDEYTLIDQVSKEEEESEAQSLKTVFLDGKLVKDTVFSKEE